MLGEVYLIPVFEYDSDLVKNKQVGFKKKHVKIEKYISFFNAINNRQAGGPEYAYERCALLIVDFSRDVPFLYNDSEELKLAGLISKDFDIEYSALNFRNFARDILDIYGKRFDISNLKNDICIKRGAVLIRTAPLIYSSPYSDHRYLSSSGLAADRI